MLSILKMDPVCYLGNIDWLLIMLTESCWEFVLGKDTSVLLSHQHKGIFDKHPVFLSSAPWWDSVISKWP